MQASDPLDKVIEEQLSGISTEEIAGAYRSLCGMMLVQTVVAFRKRAITRKDDAWARRVARRWLASKHGILTFAECCEVMNLDMDRARKALYSVAD